MRGISIAAALVLLIGVFNLPIGYYTLLRVVVFIAALAIAYVEFNERGINFWTVIFAIILILFNPLIPIYLYQKSIWIPVDIISAAIFSTYSFKKPKENEPNQ